MSIKIVLMGNNRAAIHCLEAIRSRPTFDVLVVVPHARAVHSWHSSLHDHAIAQGVRSICNPKDVNHPLFLEHLRAFSPDLILSVYYDQIFGKELLSIPRLGCVNVHPSLLPLYRGVAPLIWAIIEGQEKTGVTFHLLDEGIDTGAILMQREIPIAGEDTGYSLHQKAAACVRDMIQPFLQGLERGEAWMPRPQSGKASYYARNKASKNLIDWTLPARAINDCVRALTEPLPGCFSYHRGEKIHLWSVTALDENDIPLDESAAALRPAQILVRGQRLFAKAQDGWIEVIEAGLAGIRMSGSDLIRILELKSSGTFQSDPSHSPKDAAPVQNFIPFGAPSIGEEEISEVVETLKSGWLGMGPKTARFEAEFASYVGAKHAVAVNSCTAAIHLGLLASGVGPGDEVITTPLTFAATGNAILYTGARPVFADIDPTTLNIDPSEIERKITSRTKAILPVHFGGLPCDMGRIQALASNHGLRVVEDAAHAAGAVFDGVKIGGLGNPTCFSFYPNKNMTTVEGGMLTTNDDRIAGHARSLRLHGLDQDAWKRYLSKDLILSEVLELGFKYNLTDVQAAIGIHQLRRLEGFLATREKYAAIYDDAFRTLPGVFVFPRPRLPSKDRHALHLYLLLLDRDAGITRDQFVLALRKRGIGAAIHYVPLHLHPFYRTSLGCKTGDFPVCERVGEQILTLPLSPAMSPADVARIVQSVRTISLDSGRSES